MGTYHIHQALHAEANEPWIWIGDRRYRSRSLVKIVNAGGSSCSRRTVYCAVRQIDHNYNNKRCALFGKDSNDWKKQIAMSAWYRDALAIDPDDTEAELSFCEGIPVWRELRASCCHPDFVARLATRLGVAGVWLGIIGALLGLAALHPGLGTYLSDSPILQTCVWIGFAILLVLSFVVCRSPRAA